MKRLLALALVATVGAGCARLDASTMGWVRVETDDLILRTDVKSGRAVELAKKWQRLRNAIGENELPCAFERSNVPMEIVLLKDEQDMIDLHRRYTAGLTVRPPSEHLDSNTQYVLIYEVAVARNQLFLHELTHAAAEICFPGARPWLHEGLASFYETAQIRDGELVLGMPAYGFVPMTNVEPMFDIYPVVVNSTKVWMLPSRLAPDFSELRRMDAEQFYFLGANRSVSELRQTTAHYAGSWHAVHLLQFAGRTLHGRFRTYLTRLAEGDDDDTAWNGAFVGVDVASRYDASLDDDYKIASTPISIAPVREPSVHTMSQVDVALLRARLYGWSTEKDMTMAREYMSHAAAQAPGSADVMLHKAAFYRDTEAGGEGDVWLERALAAAPQDPQVLATAIYWYARGEDRESRRADLEAWGEALGRSAQTAFQFTEYGEYLLRVVDDPRAALEQLDKSLRLDSTSWRAYALAGVALEELGLTESAIRAFRTAIPLTGHTRSDLRQVLMRRIEKLRAE